uniref:2-aminoethanethiol dioxygenase n=1 Tax=Caligus rogercresseyi TaxID=217165 RepID=C1BQ37_CALRO|nr:2-aminoethanethiol dioxygenase [Caligus rogercresseyi]
MSPNIQRIVQFARRVASLCYERDIPFRLEGPLLEALSSLSIQELNFDSGAPFRTHKELSSYYVDIYEDNRISIGIFFLNGDTKIPLHDHPNMTGVIKCIAGNLNITSFTPIHDMSDDNFFKPFHTESSPFQRLQTQKSSIHSPTTSMKFKTPLLTHPRLFWTY